MTVMTAHMEPIKLRWNTGNKIRNLKYATKILIKRKKLLTSVREFLLKLSSVCCYGYSCCTTTTTTVMRN